jgi:hypothetical protein
MKRIVHEYVGFVPATARENLTAGRSLTLVRLEENGSTSSRRSWSQQTLGPDAGAHDRCLLRHRER